MKITEKRLRQLIREEAAHETQVTLMKWLSQQAIRLGVADHTYVVGGAVRNFVIKQPIKDIDMMIDSVALKGKDSEWLAKRLQKAIPARSNLTTNQYGVAILTVKGPWTLGGSDMQGEVIEIANARKESYGGTGGKGYKPSEVEPATAADDIKRREFTFNTLMWRLSQLAKGPDKAEIVDLTGCGLADLKAGVMACPSDPDKTFSDDPTRMLRAIKFLVKYGFRIRGDVENSIRRNAGKLRNVPPNALTTILIDTLLKDPKSAKKSLKEMKRLGLLDILADLMRSDQQFGATMQKWANNRKVLFLFDMMDMGLPMNARLDFLSPGQQARLRQVALLMPEGEPESYLDALKQPGKAMQDKRFIPSMAKERGLKGKAFGQFAKRVSDRARDLMLDNPALWKNPAQLRQRVRSVVAEAPVLNMKITEENKTMRITEKKLRQLIREELDAHTPRDPDLAAVKSVLDLVDLDLPDEVVRVALPDIRAALGGEAPADAHFARVFDAIAAAGLMDWRSGDDLNEMSYYGFSGTRPAGDRAQQGVMKRHGHPWHGNPPSTRELLNNAAAVYWEWEVRSPTRFKSEMENPDNFGGPPEMPVEFYADLIKAIKKDDRAQQKHRATAYTPGWRD